MPLNTSPFFLQYSHMSDSTMPKSIQITKQILQHSNRLLAEIILCYELIGLFLMVSQNQSQPFKILCMNSYPHTNNTMYSRIFGNLKLVRIGWFYTNITITQSPHSQTGSLLQMDETHQVLWIHCCFLTYLKTKQVWHALIEVKGAGCCTSQKPKQAFRKHFFYKFC